MLHKLQEVSVTSEGDTFSDIAMTGLETKTSQNVNLQSIQNTQESTNFRGGAQLIFDKF